MTGYDQDNIFARILRGDIPCHKVHEDADTLAFMDIMPQAEGHVLVIPKAPSRNLLDADPAVFSALMATTQRIARALRRAFGAPGVLVKQYNEAAAGQTVFHLHIHVIPCHEGQELKAHTGAMADHALLAEQAKRIAAAMGGAKHG